MSAAGKSKSVLGTINPEWRSVIGETSMTALAGGRDYAIVPPGRETVVIALPSEYSVRIVAKTEKGMSSEQPSKEREFIHHCIGNRMDRH